MQKNLLHITGSLKRKFGTSSCFKKNMWKKVQPPQKAVKKTFFSLKCTPPPFAKNVLDKGSFCLKTDIYSIQYYVK